MAVFPGKSRRFLEKSIPYENLGWSRYFASDALKPTRIALNIVTLRLNI